MRRFLTAGCLMWALHSPSMASDIFLKLDGIPGESAAVRHEGWIAVTSFEEGVSRAVTNRSPAFSALRITKPIDKSSPLLALSCANGQRIQTGTLDVMRPGANQIRFLQVKLGDVRVTAFEQSGDGPGNSTAESVALDFVTVEWTYTVIGPNGGAAGNISCSWNRQTGTGTGGGTPEDTDGDGMPDDYERLYGLNPNVPDALEDLDGDGMTNIDEFRAGTIPNRADSVFRMSATRTSTGRVSIQWQSVAGKTYRLFAAPAPEGSFVFVRALNDAEQAAGQIELETSAARQFFILDVE